MTADYFGLYDETVEIASIKDIIAIADRRWEEALNNSIGAWRLVNSTDDDFIDAFRTVERENLRDAAVIADQLVKQAKDDIDALYGQCECGVLTAGVCRKCGAYARVRAWQDEWKSRGSNSDCGSHNNIIANNGDELWTGE